MRQANDGMADSAAAGADAVSNLLVVSPLEAWNSRAAFRLSAAVQFSNLINLILIYLLCRAALDECKPSCQE